MLDSIIKLLIGDLDDKRAYRNMRKRANALPREYRYTFRKMQNYLYTVGSSGGDDCATIDIALFNDLIDLFETSAAEHRTVLDVTGGDIAGFCDALLSSSASNEAARRTRLSQTILEQSNKEEEPC